LSDAGYLHKQWPKLVRYLEDARLAIDNNHNENAKFLDQWCQQTLYSKIEPMKKVARTLRAHRELIVNWFKAKKRFSSGIVEGLNNKARLTMRKSYGFRSPEILEMALYHALGKLPEPELAHEFY
jgi:transposase